MSAKKDVNCDQICKFLQERIILTEKNVSQIYQIFSEYIQKTSRVRDKNDEISKIFINYSENEEINKTLANALANFGLGFSILGDLGDLRVQKIESKILLDLSQYEIICKNAKEEIKHIFTARDREMVKKRQLDRLRERNPRNRQQISQAETEFLRATAEVTKTIQGLENQTDDFEKRKIHDLKNIMLNFISVEMAYHAKALEVLTKTYQEVYAIDEEQDLEEFQKIKRLSSQEHVTKNRSKLNLFKTSSQSLGSLNTLFNTPRVTKPKKSKGRKMEENYNSENSETENSENEAENSDEDSNEDVVHKFLAQKSTKKNVKKNL